MDNKSGSVASHTTSNIQKAMYNTSVCIAVNQRATTCLLAVSENLQKYFGQFVPLLHCIITMDPKQMTLLTEQRGSIKASITRIQTFVNQFEREHGCLLGCSAM
jgi:hypothetical protein